MTKSNSKRRRTRERLRMRAVAAKERYKALAFTGALLIGGLVGVDEYATGMGSTFSGFAALMSFGLSAITFGVIGLAIKVDKHEHRKE